jgi:hypothetical protein
MQLNFLQLVQAAYREAGFVGDGPVTVLNQAGRKADVVRWVQQANEEIHASRTDWRFDWARAGFTLVAGQDTYNPVVDFSLSEGVRDFNRAPAANYVYPTAQGVAGRNFLLLREWADFRGMNVPQASGNVPTIFSIQPDGQVVYYPCPSVVCTVVHEYTRHAPTLAADTDLPRIPMRFHMAIAWKAVMIACGKTKDFARHDTAEEQYERLMDAMLREETPKVTIGEGPLA